MHATLSSVPNCDGFLDDCTVHGLQRVWERLWADMLSAIRALVARGFMINLRKCHFLARTVVVLGREVTAKGYQLSPKFM